MLDVTLQIVAAIEENGKEAVHEEFEIVDEDAEPDPNRKSKWWKYNLTHHVWNTIWPTMFEIQSDLLHACDVHWIHFYTVQVFRHRVSVFHIELCRCAIRSDTLQICNTSSHTAILTPCMYWNSATARFTLSYANDTASAPVNGKADMANVVSSGDYIHAHHRGMIYVIREYVISYMN